MAGAAILAPAQTPDSSGTWVAKVNSPMMGEIELVYEFKVANGKLTGTQTLPFGASPIVDGKIDGDSVEFVVETEFFGEITRRTGKGKITGDTLEITPALPTPPASRPPGAGIGPGSPGGGPPGGGLARLFTQPVIARRGTPSPSYRAPSLDYKTLPKIELPPLRGLPSNGLVQTPPMGWNSWNKFRTKIDDKTIREIADAMVSSGMRDAGYIYLNIDDGWQWKRNEKGELLPNPGFPDMKALAKYVHSKGLKLGTYSSPGPRTCGNFEGSYGHEDIDARTWADWGIDYLKYDWCSASRIWKDEDMRAVYQRMGEALRRTGRPIVYSLCQYGRANVPEWGPLVGGNLWRTTFDIRDQWQSMEQIGFNQSGLAQLAGPGRWNDPDMLEVGNGGMTATEYRAHFSLWAILAAPLIAGNDLRNMTAEIKEILLNKEIIAINQDKLGRAGYRASGNGETEIWAKPLAGGAMAVGLFNRGTQDAEVFIQWKDLRINSKPKVRDLWAHADRGQQADGFRTSVPSHGVILLRVTP